MAKEDNKEVTVPTPKKQEPNKPIPLEGMSQTTLPDGTVRTDY